MDLSVRLTLEELPEVFTGSSIHSEFIDDLVQHAMLFDPKATCYKGVLYVGKASQISEAYEEKSLYQLASSKNNRFSFACVGKPSDALLADEHSDIIYSESDLSLFALFNIIQNVFVKYGNWANTLSEIIINRGSLKDLIYASLDIIKNDIWITDQYSKVILYKVYKNVRLTEEQIAEVKENDFLPKRMIADGDEEETEGRDFASPGAQFFPIKAHNSMSLYNTFYSRGDYRLGLAFEANFRDLTEGDYVKSVILASFIQSLYSTVEVLPNSEFEFGDTALIKESLHGEVTDRTRLRGALQANGWNIEFDQLVCLALRYHNPLLGKSRRDIEPELATTGLLRSFCTCRTFVFENNVFALVNLDKSSLSLDELVDRLPEEVMNANMACGVSDVFKSLEEIRGRYLQAVVTLEICKSKSGVEKAIRYSEAMLDITFDCVTQSMPLSFYVPKEVLDLIERDAHYNSSLYETLKTYLYTNCSIAETCRKLFLQRNGAIYRLDKAKELLPSFDIRNPEDRLKLMLSMEIVDEKLFAEAPTETI